MAASILTFSEVTSARRLRQFSFQLKHKKRREVRTRVGKSNGIQGLPSGFFIRTQQRRPANLPFEHTSPFSINFFTACTTGYPSIASFSV
jgi:hypothetical protein